MYKGELKTKNGKIFVAVKSLKENATAKTQADFQREIELISELKHPNIICLLGVITKKEPMCMLFEFMSEVCRKSVYIFVSGTTKKIVLGRFT